jgi:hypothetical protein
MVHSGVVVGTLPRILDHPKFPLVYHFSGSGAFHSMLSGMGSGIGIGSVTYIGP